MISTQSSHGGRGSPPTSRSSVEAAAGPHGGRAGLRSARRQDRRAVVARRAQFAAAGVAIVS
jgi:hypothetical protein